MGFQIINDKYSNGMMAWMDLPCNDGPGSKRGGFWDSFLPCRNLSRAVWLPKAACMAARAMVVWKLGLFHRKTIRKRWICGFIVTW